MELITDPEAFDAFAADWARMVGELNYFYPGFEVTRQRLAHSNGDFCIIGDRDEAGRLLRAACFSSGRARQGFTVGRRKLFSLPVRKISKVGLGGLGSWTAQQWAEALNIALRWQPFTVLDLGEVPLGSALHTASQQLSHRFVSARSGRKTSIRWFIDLPESFSAYVAGLRSRTRHSATNRVRRFERELSFELVKVTQPEDIARFVRDGESISRKTYQWHIGQPLENDRATLTRYDEMCARRGMRCYLLYVDNAPIAFARGEIQNGVYHYETPGFDPKLKKYSPGQVMLMWVIRDLIENTDCRVLDFGEGGDWHGYKAHFGNRSVECDPLQIFHLTSPYSMAVCSAQATLSLAKNLAARVLGGSSIIKKLTAPALGRA